SLRLVSNQGAMIVPAIVRDRPGVELTSQPMRAGAGSGFVTSPCPWGIIGLRRPRLLHRSFPPPLYVVPRADWVTKIRPQPQKRGKLPGPRFGRRPRARAVESVVPKRGFPRGGVVNGQMGRRHALLASRERLDAGGHQTG